MLPRGALGERAIKGQPRTTRTRTRTLILILTLTLALALPLTRKPNLRQGLGLEIATPGRTWVFLAEDHDEQARDIGEI